MSTIINGVDLDAVLLEAINAAKTIIHSDWPVIRAEVESLGRSMARDMMILHQQQQDGALSENDIGLFLDDQKIVARLRLRSIAIVTLQLAEAILNAMTAVFRSAIYRALGYDMR
ncbi:hypothetical protein [Pseudomonas putida]|uniref:Uncharacterized protein n=1 Tax=Pseudomonas putida TaxID=303 RepID=A0A6I6XXN1_PSEPU|nr:hypothetical protein [Pseudomonas putida]QHG64930.1 hypothetical protein C2H86_11120 [Pseudomonas putida]